MTLKQLSQAVLTSRPEGEVIVLLAYGEEYGPADVVFRAGAEELTAAQFVCSFGEKFDINDAREFCAQWPEGPQIIMNKGVENANND